MMIKQPVKINPISGKMENHEPNHIQDSRDRQYWIMGLTHIDLAWKKNHSEMAELEEVFILRLLDLLEQHPDFCYVIEQAAHLRLLAKQRPDLIRRLKPFLAAGRLEFVGGMASTMETNIPNGECFIRNQKIGLEWIKENLEIDVQTGWLIDTFGINAQIPQILKQFGFRHLMANRFGGTLHNGIFIDRGLDGSEILVVGQDAYSAAVNPKYYLFKGLGNWAQVDRLMQRAMAIQGNDPFTIMPYTENEGLPLTRLIHWVEQGNRGKTGKPWRFILPRDFFAYLNTLEEPFPVMGGDLNPEFSGTFSQRVAIRVRNRQVENLLLEAEKWAAFAALSATDIDRAALKDAWWELAYIQFHDVFTGSHPTEVYLDVLERLDRVQQAAETVLRQAAVSTAGIPAQLSNKLQAAALNGLPWKRSGMIELALPEMSGVSSVSMDGSSVPFAMVEERLEILAELPPVSCGLIEIEPGPRQIYEMLPCSSAVIENETLRLECDTVSGIHQLVLKRGNQVILKDTGDFLIIQRDEGSFQIEAPASAEIPAAAGTLELFKPWHTPIGQRLIMKGVFPEFAWSPPGSILSWEIDFFLPNAREELRVTLKLHWQGEASRIRLKLNTLLENAEAIYEIPFGTVRRRPYGTNATAKGEWPAQRFVAIQNHQAGLALVNTGVPGVETANGTIWTTLLRAPKSEYSGMIPDETSSQHGNHLFKFAILPYLGDWTNAGVIELGQEMNSPVFTTLLGERDGQAQEPGSFLSLSPYRGDEAPEPAHVVLSSVKSSEDGSGDWVIRLYETIGRAALAQLFIKDACQVWASDVWERKGDAIACSQNRVELELNPFEIRTLVVHRQNASSGEIRA